MNMAICSRVTLPSGEKVVAVTPLVTPNCLIWLIAVWMAADSPLMSVKP